jgi:hypothetical protein
MSLLRAYFKAYVMFFDFISALFFLFTLVFHPTPISVCLLYLCLVASLAGPVKVLMEKGSK